MKKLTPKQIVEAIKLLDAPKFQIFCDLAAEDNLANRVIESMNFAIQDSIYQSFRETKDGRDV